jgi:hypothetical protein
MLFWLVPQTNNLQVDRAGQILCSPGKPGLSIQDLEYKPETVRVALAKVSVQIDQMCTITVKATASCMRIQSG